MARKVASATPSCKLAQAGLDVATKLDDPQIGPPRQELRPAPQARRADNRPLGQIAERAVAQRDKGIAHILARQIGVDQQPVRLVDRHVLHRMHGDVDAAVQQRILDLAGEQALAADLLERAVLHPVAGGLDHHDLEGVAGQSECRHQAVTRLMRLGQSQQRAARADAQRRKR